MKSSPSAAVTVLPEHAQTDASVPSLWTADGPGQAVPHAAPRIHGTRIFGVRPGSPVQFKVPATGAGELVYSATGLPEGVTIEENTGILSGRATVPGEYAMTVQVSSAYGEDVRGLTLRVGNEICLTPPMGWNSWYAHSDLVSEAAVRAAAQAMVERGLAAHGWSYINIDDCWQGQRDSSSGAIQPNERFGYMTRLCADIHALGLKIGIYSTPWMGTYAGFVGGSAPNERHDYAEFMLPEGARRQHSQIFGAYPAINSNGVGKVGPVWLFDRDVAQWEAWGIDFVKVDWHPNDVPTATRIASDLRAASRDMVYSISNAATLDSAAELSRTANLWRTTGDIFDNWHSISEIATAQIAWQRFGGPGHWNDPDMLQVGALGITNGADGQYYPTKLTRSEQVFQMSLWCLLSAPLFISCDIGSLDEFTLQLLINDEVLAVNQDSAGLPATHTAIAGGDLWAKPLSDGSVAVGLFNREDSDRVMSLDWDALSLQGSYVVRNLWRHENGGIHEGHFSILVPSHGAAMLRLHQ